ncbi:NADH-quinone oxidoreductase subunit M, partial [bacterium]|nr:NADH-quinone oxidoreductase subunit M [bacterium]
MTTLLPMLILLPAASGLGLLLFRSDPRQSVRLASYAAGLTLILSLMLATRFHDLSSDAAGTIQPRLAWTTGPIAVPIVATPAPTIRLELGLDGPGIGMILLTSAVVLAILLLVPRQISHRSTDFVSMLLLTEAALLGAFLSMDVLLFYIFFELTLLPILVLMIGWGTDQAQPAAIKFFLFTLAGSLPMLAGLVALVILSAPNPSALTISLPELAVRMSSPSGDIMVSPLSHDATTQNWIFWLILLGLGIKMAILPLHTWLPTTYLASHPLVTALLAAVVLKLGVFGMLRLLLPLLPMACQDFSLFWGPALGAVAIVYGSLIALAQRDIRLLLAYGSLGHVGFITIGLFSLESEGIAGATLQMVNHGITTAALFLML